MSLSPLLSLAALSLQKKQEWQPLEKKQSVARLGWWLRQSLFEKAVARSALLLKAENWGFLFLCKLQGCFCHLPTANSCQPLWEGQSRGGVSMEQLLLSLFFSSRRAFCSFSCQGAFVQTGLLFPGQRKQKQAADTWRASFRRFLTRTLCSLESCLDRVFYL